MSSPNAPRVAPIMHMIADELATVRAMLLRYEAAALTTHIDATQRTGELQGFDLALQMLKDLEHLSRVVADRLPEGIAVQKPLPTTGLLLERSRHRLNVSAGLIPPQTRHEPGDAVDLF